MPFDFLWCMRGSVPIAPDMSNAAVIATMQDLLIRQYKAVSEQSDTHVAFDDRMWIRFGAPEVIRPRIFDGAIAMLGFDRGYFRIEQSRNWRTLRYDLRSLHACLYGVLVAAFFGGLTALYDETSLALCIGAGVFAVSYGVPQLLTFFWTPSMLRRALKDGPPL